MSKDLPNISSELQDFMAKEECRYVEKPFKKCPECNGKGRIEFYNYYANKFEICPLCKGKKIIPNDDNA